MATIAYPLRRSARTARALSAGERRALLVLLGIAAALTVLDGLSTIAWLELGHAEANPLLAALAGVVGPVPAMVVRIVVGIAFLALLATTIGRARLAPYAVVGVTGVLLGVGLWHGYGLLLHVGMT